MDLEDIYCLCEALFFSTDEPVREDVIADIVADFCQGTCAFDFREFQTWFNHRTSGLMITRVAGGWQIVTKPEFADAIRRLKTSTQKARFSRASLETLAIIAYRQPITSPEIESIRGVESSGVLKNLLEKKLIRILGRKRGPGNPLLYGTTQQFLLTFGLDDLKSLPALDEFETAGPQKNTSSEHPSFFALTETISNMKRENHNEN